MRWPPTLRSIRTATARAVTALDRAAMPVCCVFCGVVLEAFETGICHGCANDLPWNDNACPRCAEPQQTPLSAGLACAACQATPPPFTAAAALFRYAFPVDAAIKLFKFRRRLDYVPAFGAIMASALTFLPPDVDCLVPVPLHWRRQALRGFNQAEELGREMHKHADLPVIRMARRVRATPPQSGLDAGSRRKNLRGAFSIVARNTVQHALIVDDVITTGATCRELASALMRSGASQVSVLTLARRQAHATPD